MNLTAPIEAQVTMTATGTLRHRCPFVHEEDNGTITLTWTTSGATLELHALRQYLNSFADLEISHEDLTERIRGELGEQPGISNVTIKTAWDTAGMEINCSTWLTQPAPPAFTTP